MKDDSIKAALRVIPYGFYAITSHHDGIDNAMVANWLSQVSFSPRRLILGLQNTCYTYGLVQKSGVFCINIFRKEDQESLMPYTKSLAKAPDKMEGAVFEPAPETQCPVLQGTAAYIECRVLDIVDINAGHDIVIAEPINAAVLKELEYTDALTLMDVGWHYAG